MLRIISLGAGVQSSTMALMFACGELTPMPDCAIFADTGAEPKKVYDWLNWLETQLPFPVHRVMHRAGLLSEVLGVTRGRKATPPLFTKMNGKAGVTRRQCTSEFKIVPIEQKVRGLLGLGRGEQAPRGNILAIQYIGISTDEWTRMKHSRLPYIKHEWPLIEKNMSRGGCLDWMKAKGYPMPSKSSCTFCPYHSDELWRDMKLNDPKSFDQAVTVDRHLRSGQANITRGLDGEFYLHRSLKPLEEVDFRNAADLGQTDMFNEECEGMCGV